MSPYLSLVRVIRKRRERRARLRSVSTPGWLWRLTTALIVIALVSVLSLLLISSTAVAAVYLHFAHQLPDPSAIETKQEKFETVRIYDRTGKHLLYESIDPRPYRGDRTYKPLPEISPWLQKATIALEDRSFYSNPGVNIRGIGRAFFANLKGQSVQGGSSITQQLIKNVLFSYRERTERSFTRKIKEIIMAVEITRRYPKDKILEWYLNYNFYGNAAYGIEAAARIYFDKPAKDLDLAEAAMLAHLPQYPALNPINNPEDAKRRQEKVLQAMVVAGYITQKQADAAYAEPLHVRKSAAERYHIKDAPHFALYVLNELDRRYNTPEDPFRIWKEGFVVYTTLDYDLQKQAEEIAREHIKQMEADTKINRNAHNAAVVVLRPSTGEILAMVGSLDFYNSAIQGQVNMVTANRQPGSSFKPFTYMTAFAGNFTPASMVLDVRQVFPDPQTGVYVPENYSRRYHGPQSLRQALQRSLNIPAVWLMSKVGVKNVLKTAHRMGITTLNQDYYGLSLTLGGGEVKLMDMAYAFGVWANNGYMSGRPVPTDQQRPGYRTLNPVSILLVKNKDGRVIDQFTKPETTQVVTPQLTYLMNNVLSDPKPRPMTFGRFAKYLQLPDGRPVAAKTGTTNDFRDAWTIGYTPQIVTGIWVGNADNDAMHHVSGAIGAAPIWRDVMAYALRDTKPVSFTEPPGIVHMDVCWPSGLLVTDACKQIHAVEKEVFLPGKTPTKPDNVWQVFRINRENGKLATPYTPPDLIEEKTFEILPPEADDWVREAKIPQPPKEYDDTYANVVLSGDTVIAQPHPYSYVHEMMEIRGNAEGNFSRYRILLGPGLSPDNWQQIGPDHGNRVHNNVLEYLDTRMFPDGLYTLRLSVIGGDGVERVNDIPIIIDNTPPEVKITSPTYDELFVKEDDEYVMVQVNATDAWAMDRVEFYIDDTAFATSTVPPYNERWNIVISDTTVYTETRWLKVTAFDKAGNSSDSELLPIRVISKDKKVQPKQDKNAKSGERLSKQYLIAVALPWPPLRPASLPVKSERFAASFPTRRWIGSG